MRKDLIIFVLNISMRCEIQCIFMLTERIRLIFGGMREKHFSGRISGTPPGAPYKSKGQYVTITFSFI